MVFSLISHLSNLNFDSTFIVIYQISFSQIVIFPIQTRVISIVILYLYPFVKIGIFLFPFGFIYLYPFVKIGIFTFPFGFITFSIVILIF